MVILKAIERKKKMIKKYSFGDEDRYQYIILKLIEGIKNYKFKKIGENFLKLITVYIMKGKFKENTILKCGRWDKLLSATNILLKGVNIYV